MKKMLIVLILPCLLAASDKTSPQKRSFPRKVFNSFKREFRDDLSAGQKVANGANLATCGAAGGYLGWSGACKIIAAISTGGCAGIGMAVVETVAGTMAIGKVGDNVNAYIDPTSIETPQQKASRESNTRAAIAEEKASATFRRCLSEHAHCPDVNGLGIPKRCNSPARDFAMINDREADRMIANYLKFTQNRKGST